MPYNRRISCDCSVSLRPLSAIVLAAFLILIASLAAFVCADESGKTESPSKRRLKRIPSGIDVGAVVAEEQSRIRNSKPQGEPVTVDLFGGSGTGRTFVFVIDRSK